MTAFLLLIAATSIPDIITPKPILPMVLIGGILAVTFAVIAFEWMHKTVAALLVAIMAVAVALVLNVYGWEHPYLAVHEFLHHDLGMLGVIVGTSIIVTIASESGLFHFMAVRLLKLNSGTPGRQLTAIQRPQSPLLPSSPSRPVS